MIKKEVLEPGAPQKPHLGVDLDGAVSAATPADHASPFNLHSSHDAAASGPLDTAATTSNSSNHKKTTIKFKRPRTSRLCKTCHDRKVRCDSHLKVPCTNCVSFNCECVLPSLKRVRRTKKEIREERLRKLQEQAKFALGLGIGSLPLSQTLPLSKTPQSPPVGSTPSSASPQQQQQQLPNDPIAVITAVDLREACPDFNHMITAHKSDLLYLGSSVVLSSSNHYKKEAECSHEEIDELDLQILTLKQCFKLPSTAVCHELLDLYFAHVHPYMPILNRTEFVRNYYHHLTSPPSLLLLQSVLMAGSRYSRNPQLLDEHGDVDRVSHLLYQRAKLLFDARLGNKPLELVQLVLILGWFWDGPEDVTQNIFYWTRVLITLLQGYGFHKTNALLSLQEAKDWRRCWWTLFTRDRTVLLSFGRSIVIDLEDCDVAMLTLDDFDESPRGDDSSPYNLTLTQRLYSINYIKMCEIIGIVLKQKYTVQLEKSLDDDSHLSFIKRCDLMMVNWLNNLPVELQYSITDKTRQNQYASMIMCLYYVTLSLIHRTNILRRSLFRKGRLSQEYYPSWGITFQSSHMIVIICKNMMDRDELRFLPSIIVATLFSAAIMLIYHIDNKNPKVSSTLEKLLNICSKLMMVVSKQWSVGYICLQMADTLRTNKSKRSIVIRRTLASSSASTKKKLTDDIDRRLALNDAILQKSVGSIRNFKPSQLFPSIETLPRTHPAADPLQNASKITTPGAVDNVEGAAGPVSGADLSIALDQLKLEGLGGQRTEFPILAQQHLSDLRSSSTTPASVPLARDHSANGMTDLYDLQFYNYDVMDNGDGAIPAFDILNNENFPRLSESNSNSENNSISGVGVSPVDDFGLHRQPQQDAHPQIDRSQQNQQDQIFMGDATANGVPNSLNIGDWFNFLQY